MDIKRPAPRLVCALMGESNLLLKDTNVIIHTITCKANALRNF